MIPKTGLACVHPSVPFAVSPSVRASPIHKALGAQVFIAFCTVSLHLSVAELVVHPHMRLPGDTSNQWEGVAKCQHGRQITQVISHFIHWLLSPRRRHHLPCRLSISMRSLEILAQCSEVRARTGVLIISVRTTLLRGNGFLKQGKKGAMR